MISKCQILGDTQMNHTYSHESPRHRYKDASRMSAEDRKLARGRITTLAHHTSQIHTPTAQTTDTHTEASRPPPPDTDHTPTGRTPDEVLSRPDERTKIGSPSRARESVPLQRPTPSTPPIILEEVGREMGGSMGVHEAIPPRRRSTADTASPIRPTACRERGGGEYLAKNTHQNFA